MACGYSAIGAVVGATYPEQGKILRALMPKVFILVPGYGAQAWNSPLEGFEVLTRTKIPFPSFWHTSAKGFTPSVPRGKILRALMPKVFILVPGYGAQGAKGRDLAHFFIVNPPIILSTPKILYHIKYSLPGSLRIMFPAKFCILLLSWVKKPVVAKTSAEFNAQASADPNQCDCSLHSPKEHPHDDTYRDSEDISYQADYNQ